MGDPKASGPLGRVTGPLADFGRRLRNLEKSIRNRLTVTNLYSSGDIGAGGNIMAAMVSAFGIVSGSAVNAATSMNAPQGNFSAGVKSAGARTNTLTNSPVQLYIDQDGVLGVSASTLAKKNVTGDYVVNPDKFLAVELKTWAYKETPTATGMGPIADALDAAGLTEFVLYNVDGTIQGVRSDMLIIGLWSMVKQIRAGTLARQAKQSHQTFTTTMGSTVALNSTKAFTVAWPAEFADTDYLVTASVLSAAGVSVVGATAAVVPGSKTTKGCTVNVATGVALISTQTLYVEAVHI